MKLKRRFVYVNKEVSFLTHTVQMKHDGVTVKGNLVFRS